MARSPKRILVVDNDRDVLDSVEYNLRTAGYEVLTASSPEEAERRLLCEIVHLAIIDVRLRHEDRAEDLSGFNVARKISHHIPCIIFTAYEDKENIKKALGEVRAKTILDKKEQDAAAQLIEIVNRLFASEIKINFELEIEGSPALEIIASQIEVPAINKYPQPSADDVRQVFQMLFHDATGVHIAPLLSPESAPTFTQAGSVLVRAQPHFENAWGAPVVVKFSTRDEIEREANNYRRIKSFLGGQRLAVLENETYSRQIGGLLYRLIGAHEWEDIRTFGQVFLDESTETVTSLLERFFRQTFETLFADARRETIDLTITYTEGLHLTLPKLQTALQEFHPRALSDPSLRFKGLKSSYTNPIMWACPGGHFRRFDVVSRQCLCHGDLHGRNILVDADGHFWLIDFARVAESHALRDFAELETDIKFSLLPVVDLKALFPFEQALLAPANFQETPPDISFANGRLDHAYRVVLALRRIAAELIDLAGDMREYYQALFIHTLNVMRLRHISAEKKEHVLLSAALICQRLEDWPEWELVPASASPPEPTFTSPQPDENTTTSANRHASRPAAQDQLQQGTRLAGAGLFFLLSTGVVVFLWWAMQHFKPGWLEYAATLLLLAVFAIIVFTLLGLVAGPTAIEALQKIASNPFNKRLDKPGSSEQGEESR